MAADFPKVSLALSLHAPSQRLRERIVPSARAHPLDRIVAAARQYQEATGNKVFVEYVLLAGVNDGVEIARELGALLEGHRVMVNLIPWNPVLSPDMHFGAPPPAQVRVAECLPLCLPARLRVVRTRTHCLQRWSV